MISLSEAAGRFGTDRATLQRQLEILAGEWDLSGDASPLFDEHGQITPIAEDALAERFSAGPSRAGADEE